MQALIDRFTATRVERKWACEWADFAVRRFGHDASARLRKNPDPGERVRSARALRMAVRRVEANLLLRMVVRTHGGTTAAPVRGSPRGLERRQVVR